MNSRIPSVAIATLLLAATVFTAGFESPNAFAQAAPRMQAAPVAQAAPASQPAAPVGPSKLLVVWTSGDREVALKMVFMYTFNAKRSAWWQDIRLVVWGPSAKLLSEDEELQNYVKKMKAAGVEVLACKACADQYGVSAKLEALGITVKYMGVPLTEMLKSGWTTITF